MLRYNIRYRVIYLKKKEKIEGKKNEKEGKLAIRIVHRNIQTTNNYRRDEWRRSTNREQ